MYDIDMYIMYTKHCIGILANICIVAGECGILAWWHHGAWAIELIAI